MNTSSDVFGSNHVRLFAYELTFSNTRPTKKNDKTT